MKRLRGIRVLAAINGLELFGHERGNIEVFKCLRDQGAAVLIGVNAIDDGGEVGKRCRELEFETFNIPFGNQWSWQWLKSIPLSFFGKARQVIACSLAFRRAIREFAPTHFHLGSPLAYSYLAIALALDRTPLIYRMGDCPPIDSPFNLRIWRMAVRRTSRLVCNSDYVRRMAQETGAHEGIVIHNLAPIESAACRPERSESEGVFRLLYVGAVSEHKGLIPLIEALASLAVDYPDLRLDVVGGGSWDGEFRDRLVGIIRSLGVEEMVTFHGYVPNPSKYYLRSDIHVVPSLCEESSANVVVEAKCSGVPSIVFPSGGLPEMINHQVDGYICSEKSSAALVEALRWMLADPVRLRRMGQAARADSDARFGPQRFAREWAAVYLEPPPRQAKSRQVHELSNRERRT